MKVKEIVQKTGQAVSHLFGYSMVGALVLFISLFFPSSTHFQYEFEVGERWRYGDLSAPFDFPIQKDEATINEERGDLDEEFTPYYRRDTNILEERQAFFVDLINLALD